MLFFSVLILLKYFIPGSRGLIRFAGVPPMLSGRMSDKYGERVPMSGGFLLVFFAMVVFLLAETYPAFIGTWILFGAGVGLLSPAYQALISKVVPRQSLGAFTGLFHSSLGFISLPAPWIGARLWERFNPKLPFLITAIISLLTIIPTWLFFKLPDQPAPDADQALTPDMPNLDQAVEKPAGSDP